VLIEQKNNEDESGSIIIKDINGLATHIINKINNMNDDVVSTLRNEKEENQNVSGDIASGISNIQESLKTEVETNGVPEQQPELPQTDEQQPAEEPQQEQPVEEQQEQPVEEQEQPVEEQQEQPVDEQQEQPVDEQQEQLVDEQQINEEGEVNEIVPEKLAFKFVRPANMPVY
jgi:outer membrane biosynthesis protein TonB